MISKKQRARLAEIWKDTLGLENIDLDRAFVEAGGTSLLANELVDRLSRELGIVVPVIQVFEYPTLRLLLRALEGNATPLAWPVVSREQRTSRSSGPICSMDGTRSPS
jgi:bacitracin synthase 2